VEQLDVLVVGAGVVGLAVARHLARAGRDVMILEAAEAIGTETSSRNSEVIHAGIYYPQGSLKARLCVRGRALLYEFLAQRALPHARCGKLIVATAPGQADQLETIRTRAAANGVDDLRLLSGAEASALEPALRCNAALLSPSTGIIDSHPYMLSLLGDAEARGATLVCETPVTGGAATPAGIELATGGADPMRLRCKLFINAAGLSAPALARAITGIPPERIPGTWWAKGNYFTLSGRSPFSRLIYPVPVPGGLGTHLTLDLAGQARFGPDVEWIEAIDYRVDPRRGDSFVSAIRRYWPALPDGALQPAYAGVRPKIVPPGAPGQDFWIEGPRDHGVAGLINLFGIESPGLTSSLAIAGHVAALATAG
jgi:L-2-hydroxyglutarate oxidase LhgO